MWKVSDQKAERGMQGALVSKSSGKLLVALNGAKRQQERLEQSISPEQPWD